MKTIHKSDELKKKRGVHKSGTYALKGTNICIEAEIVYTDQSRKRTTLYLFYFIFLERLQSCILMFKDFFKYIVDI